MIKLRLEVEEEEEEEDVAKRGVAARGLATDDFHQGDARFHVTPAIRDCEF